MTRNRALKRRVRARARRTGESYTAALRHLRSAETSPPAPPGEPVRLPRSGWRSPRPTFQRNPSDDRAFSSAGDEVRRLMHRARTAGADLVGFPEATLCFPDKQALSRTADELTEADGTFAWDALDREIHEIREAAGTLSLWTVLGAQHRDPTAPTDTRPTTGLLVIDPAGEIAARYDERMLSRSKQAYPRGPDRPVRSSTSTASGSGWRPGSTCCSRTCSATTRPTTSTVSSSPPPVRPNRPRPTR